MTAAGFVVCLDAAGLDDLIQLKVYRTIPDARAAENGLLRVVDESGEDYLYPADRFLVLDLHDDAAARLAATAAVS